jgi:hypothetical protein
LAGPFLLKYTAGIKEAFPEIKIIGATHQPADRQQFVKGVKELLCPTLTGPQTMADLIRGSMKIPPE